MPRQQLPDITSSLQLLESTSTRPIGSTKKLYKMKISLILLALAALVLVGYAHPAPEGNIQYGVDEHAGGSRPSVRVENTWESDDKKTKAQVYGNWERTYGGRMNGDRTHGGGFKIQHSWR